MNLVNPYLFAAAGPTDPYFSDVLLLMHCDGTHGSTTFVDSSSYARTITAYNGAALTTASYKFATASASFDGTDDYVGVATSSDWVFGLSTDFTVEFWMWADSTDTENCGIGQNGTGSYFAISGGTLYAGGGGGSGNLCSYSYAGYYDQWVHVAFTRSGSTPRLFINGALVNTGTNNTWGQSGTMRLMNGVLIGGYGKGKIDELRITKNVARYTASFTPSTTAFPNS